MRGMNPAWITVAVLLSAQAVLVIRWLFTKTANDRIARKFVRDMATNHLPHIYQALRDIASASGVELKEPPLVQFVELNGHSRKADVDDAG